MPSLISGRRVANRVPGLCYGKIPGVRAMAACVLAIAGTAGAQIDRSEVGRELARVAGMDLVLRENPGPSDYLLAANLLAVASDLRPDDGEVARLAAFAAWAGGDQALLLDATRGVIRADPADTVAQLRLISANINSRQTAEQRLAAYARILGESGKALDRSVRSRLALDAALLEREQGDTQAFESRLMQAVELDPTNKDAVSLAARTFSTEQGGAINLIDWQIRLLLADPFDPHIHLSIARICAGQGALDSAQRFLENAVRLFETSGGELPALLRSQRLALQWQQAGPRQVLDSLNAPLEDSRNQAAEIIQLRKDAGEPHDDIRAPEDIRYDLPIEQIRLLAANALEDSGAIDASLNDFALSTSESVEALIQAFSVPGADQSTIGREMIRVFVDLQVARGMVGRQGEQIREEIDLFVKNIPAAASEARRALPWIAYANGEYEQAIQEANNPTDGSLLSLLVAMSSEKLGDFDTASRIYKVFARLQALDAYGAFARSRLVAMGREGETITADGRALERRLSGVPGWIDQMLDKPNSFMRVSAEAVSGASTQLNPVSMRLRVRNTASIPLGLGSSRPIGSRFLLVPRAAAAADGFSGTLTPAVLDLERRLRLKPLEDLEVTVPADSWHSHWLRMVNAHIAQRDRYRAIQSFAPSRLGGLGPGPLGLVGETGIVQQAMLPMSRFGVDALVSAIQTGDQNTVRSAAIATLCRVYQRDGALALSSEQITRIASAWTARFAGLSDTERALVLLILPHGGQSPGFESFDAAVLETLVGEGLSGVTSDPGLMTAALLTRVRSPESPLFELASESKSTRVRALSSLVSERLRSMRPGWATLGPGVEAAAPRGRPERVFSGLAP